MHYLLGVGALLLLAFLAPVKTTLALTFVALVSVLATLVLSRLVAGIEVTVSEATRAIGLSFALLLLAATVLVSFVAGTGINTFAGASAFALFGGFASAYALGFVVTLRVAFLQGLVVALGTAGAATLAIVAIRRIAA